MQQILYIKLARPVVSVRRVIWRTVLSCNNNNNNIILLLLLLLLIVLLLLIFIIINIKLDNNSGQVIRFVPSTSN